MYARHLLATILLSACLVRSLKLQAIWMLIVFSKFVQVINVELHNVMRMAGKLYQRYHSPMNAQLVGVDDASINGSAYTLLKQIGGVEVDVPSCTAAIEAAAMQAAFDQTDRVFWEWHSYDPVNASMYSAVNQMKRRIRRQVTRQGK